MTDLPFMERVEYDTNGGCWLWTGQEAHNGYGVFKKKRAHRVSYEMHNGPIPKDLVICHKCDTPACVNPSHLFAGSVKDNIQDMISKGRRGACKSRPNNHRMKPDQIAIAMDMSISIMEASRRTGFAPTSIRGWRFKSNKTARFIDVLKPDADRIDVINETLNAAAKYLIQQYGASYGLDHEIDRARILAALSPKEGGK